MRRSRFSFFVCSLFLGLCFGAVGTAQEEIRSWKGADGKVIAEGEYVSLDDGNVCILTKAGTGKMIPLADLSKEDQAFVARQGGDLGKIEGELAKPEVIGGGPKSEILKTPSDAAAKRSTDTRDLPLESDTAPANEEVETETTAGAVPDAAAGRGNIQKKVKDEKDRYASHKKVVPFDFESLFDEGDYGSRVSLGLWRKLNREGKHLFILPESMQDVRSVCDLLSFKPNDQTTLDAMKKVIRETFQSDIAIWGKMERVPGHRWEVYDVWVKCYDFSADPPLLIFEKNGRTEAVAEVMSDEGHYIGPMMKQLISYVAPQGKVDPMIEERWKNGPNLVIGGDFQEGKSGVPNGWESRGGQTRVPLGSEVKWIAEPGHPSNKIIQFDMSAAIAEGPGSMYYCKPFVVENGATYRFQCRYRSHGPRGIVFIKCSDVLDSKFHPTADALQEGYADKFGQQTREVYRSQQNMFHYPVGEWVTHTQDFTPRHTKYSPKFGRVMLYAYHSAGKVEYDDIVVKKISDPDPAELRKKVERHSLDTKTTIKEMEENERRLQNERGRRQEIKETPKLK